MSTNISKQKREELLAKIKAIRTFIASAEQDEMDLYRPSAEHDEQWKVKFFLTLTFYESGCYTKEVHDAVLAEEEAERRQKKH